MMIAKEPRLYFSASNLDFESERASDGRADADRPERHPDRAEDAEPGGDAPRRNAPTPRPPASVLRLLRPLLDICVFGGVTVTPILSIMGWIGLMLPTHSALHQVASPLLCVAVVWLAFAIAAAHTFSVKQINRRTAK
jgi:hypothetical protein